MTSGWGGPAASNPFLEDTQADNPFASNAAVRSDVETPLSGSTRPAQQPFGSPLSSTPSPGAQARSGPLQEVPLFDSYSSSTQYATPRTSFSPSSGSSAWASNGKGSPAVSSSAAFETSAPPATGVSKKGSGLGKLWGGSSPGSAASVPPVSSAAAADLARREADLKRREADLAAREAQLRASGGVAATKNWPRFWKLTHMDIAGDIPADRQALVRLAYFAWCLICAGYIWNFIAMTAFFIGGTKKVSLWVFAGLVMVTGVPLSFLTWYRSLYFAAKSDGAARWIWYLLSMLINIVWAIWMVIGIKPDLGGYSAGVFEMISQFDAGGGKGVTFAIMCIINVALFGLGAALSIIVYGRSMRAFRSGPRLPENRVRMAYDFDSDTLWSSYLNTVEIPPGRPELVDRVRARWYKREVDPELDLDLIIPPKPAPAAQPNPAAKPPVAPRAAPAAAPTPRAAAAPAAAQSQPTLGQVALLMGHLFYILATVLAIQPLAPRLAYISFSQACRLSFGIHATRLYQRVGAPKLTSLRGYLEQATSCSEWFYLLTCFMASGSPWLWLALVSPAIQAAYFLVAGLQPMLAGVPAWDRWGGAAHRWLTAHREQALHVMAVVEIGAVFQLVLGVMRVGPRALMTGYVYLKQLQGRYWHPETRAYHSQVWALLGDKAQPLLRALPVAQRGVDAGVGWFQRARPQGPARP